LVIVFLRLSCVICCLILILRAIGEFRQFCAYSGMYRNLMIINKQVYFPRFLSNVLGEKTAWRYKNILSQSHNSRKEASS
jgi:hypothetical protein